MRNSEIVTISNQYKDTLDDFIDILDPKSLDRVGPINERSRNTPMFESSLADFFKGDCLNENLPNRLSQLVPKTENSQVRQHCVVAPQAGYGKSQRGRKDRWENKINPMIGGSSNTETSVYHHVIDR